MSTSATENRQNSSKVQKAFRTPRSLSASQRASPLQPRRSAPVKLTYLQTALPRREGGISCSQMSSTAVSRCSSTFRLHAALTGSHLRAQGANDWFQSFGSVLKQQRRKLSGVKDEGIERLVSTVYCYKSKYRRPAAWMLYIALPQRAVTAFARVDWFLWHATNARSVACCNIL